MNALTWCSSLMCAAALALHSPSLESADILPPAKSGFALEIKADSAPSMLDLVQEYERVTELHLVMTKEVAAELSKSRTGLTRSLAVPQDQVHTLVETFLADAGYCTVLLHAQEPMLLAIKKLQGTSINANAVYVDFSKLASIEKHPALLCWTILDLDAIPVGELTNSIHANWNETDFRFMTAFGGSSSVLMMGRGKDVATRARLLVEMNESERRKAAGVASKSTSSGSAIK